MREKHYIITVDKYGWYDQDEVLHVPKYLLFSMSEYNFD